MCRDGAERGRNPAVQSVENPWNSFAGCSPRAHRQSLAACSLRLPRRSFRMRPQKITFGEMRSGGAPTGILIYCADYRCNHSVEMSADHWPDDMRLSDIEPRFICDACGKRGADVRPDF